ncbi:MAG: hypothetical protein ABSE84_08035, partial [Isosphaeraceae bacterium]
ELICKLRKIRPGAAQETANHLPYGRPRKHGRERERKGANRSSAKDQPARATDRRPGPLLNIT